LGWTNFASGGHLDLVFDPITGRVKQKRLFGIKDERRRVANTEMVQG
jgi:hypothetical protein